MSPPVVYRDLFIERPYGAALEEKYLKTYCSTCFKKNATTVCERECEKIRYCDDKCRDDDRANHEYECQTFKTSTRTDPFTRLLARLLTRRLIDGGVADLSDGFPANIQNRRLDDLMSHQEDIEAHEERSIETADTLAAFRRAYRDTVLIRDWDLVKRFHGVMVTNSFSVSGALDLVYGHQKAVGLALYLNVSRFNHSCRPDLGVHFDGANIIIQYPSTAEGDRAVAEERTKMTRTAEKFNNLTLSYGFGECFTNDSYFPFRQQRRESLALGYFFECQCSMCSDEREAELELHAAAIECEKCAEPYVWKEVERRRTSCMLRSASPTMPECRRSCACVGINQSERNKVKKYQQKAKADANMKILETQWNRVMSYRMDEQYADEIVKRCEPVWRKALPLWHNTANLRMNQLQERLFNAYYALITDDWQKKGSVSIRELKRGVSLCEATIAWYDRYFSEMTCDTSVAAYAGELAKLFQMAAEISTTPNDIEVARERAAYWFRYAAAIWRAYGKYAPGFCEQLEEAAREVENMSMVVEEE